MKNFEKKLKRETDVYSEKVEEVASRASEMTEFQEAVKNAKNRLEAIIIVRALLRSHFPEIDDIPKPNEQSGTHASNEFMIAKHVIDLLYEK